MNILITGASSGLGRRMHAMFLGRGHTVIGTTHDGVVSENEPGMVFFDSPSDLPNLEALADKVMKQFSGGLNVLINNAGVNAICPFEELTQGFIEEIMRVNFVTPVLLAKTFLPWMTKPGTVVNIISDAAWRPMRHSLAYNCSKAALDMATKQMARELTKPNRLSVIGIRPGKMSNTNMSSYIDQRVREVRGWSESEAREYFKASSVTGLEINPYHVAEFIYGIVMSPLAQNMSGACLDLVG